MNIKHTTPKARIIRKALYKEEVNTKPKKEKPYVFALASTNSIKTSNAQQKGKKVHLNKLTMDYKNSTLNTNNSNRSISNNSLSVNVSSSDIIGVKKKKANVVNDNKNLSFNVHKSQTLVKSTTQVIINNNNVSKVDADKKEKMKKYIKYAIIIYLSMGFIGGLIALIINL